MDSITFTDLGNNVSLDIPDLLRYQIYSASDFVEMATQGINTVQIAVPTVAFAKGDDSSDSNDFVVVHGGTKKVPAVDATGAKERRWLGFS